LDPNTFAVLASFGSSAGIPSYPASVWTGNGLVCIVCNGVPYALTEFDGEVAAIRADMMTQAGFDQNVVHARCVMCAGASGGSTATAFLAWQGGVYNPTVPVYVVTVSTGAETYNPSTWPATNPHITHAAVGAIAASVVDPTQPNMAVSSLGYDLADGNLLLHVSTGTTTGSNFFIIKVRSTDAAVLWSVPVDALVRVSLEQSRINGSLWVFESTGTGTSWRIDTLTGHATIQPLNGATYTAPGEPVIDSENAVALFWGSFAIRSGSPVPVSGTGAFTNGWALMGGATEVTTITTAAAVGNLISLRWSDDRGHSYGSLVSQPIGATGEYRKSLQWQRLGMCRDRVFEISWSTPMATALQGAWVTAEVADADTPPKEQGE
jgi:hypothetical protein